MSRHRIFSKHLWSTLAAKATFLTGIGFVAAAYGVSRYMTGHRRRVLPALPDHQPVSIPTADGLRLACWLTDHPKPRGTVALFHGMRQDREFMLPRVLMLREAGYRCVNVDLRSHGQSEGKHISLGWHEREDARAVAAWIDNQYPNEPKFALGFSMGAAAVCLAGPQCGWSKVVLEAVFADLRVAFERRIDARYPPWLHDLCPAVCWFTEKRLKMKMADIRPAEAIRRFVGTPILAIVGENDRLTPPCDVRQVADQVPGGADFAIIPGAGHNDLCDKGGSAYRDRVLDFLARP
jgi:hypothetical protein